MIGGHNGGKDQYSHLYDATMSSNILPLIYFNI